MDIYQKVKGIAVSSGVWEADYLATKDLLFIRNCGKSVREMAAVIMAAHGHALPLMGRWKNAENG